MADDLQLKAVLVPVGNPRLCLFGGFCFGVDPEIAENTFDLA